MAETEKTERSIAPIGGPKPVMEASPETESQPAPMMDDEEYERLLDMYDVSFKNFAEGEVVTGLVRQVSESDGSVDVGYQSEGCSAGAGWGRHHGWGLAGGCSHLISVSTASRLHRHRAAAAVTCLACQHPCEDPPGWSLGCLPPASGPGSAR